MYTGSHIGKVCNKHGLGPLGCGLVSKLTSGSQAQTESQWPSLKHLLRLSFCRNAGGASPSLLAIYNQPGTKAMPPADPSSVLPLATSISELQTSIVAYAIGTCRMK